jgi:hypothetical protein
MAAALESSPLALLYPALGKLLSSPGFVSALIDAKWLENIDPLLKVPDLISGEDQHWPSLLEASPTLKDLDLPSDGSAAGDAMRNARRAALRTIAVAAGLGKQKFAQTALFGGEPFLKVTLGGGIELKLGRCESVRWASSPVAVNKAKELAQKPEIVDIAEKGLMPLLGYGEAQFPEVYGYWMMLLPLRNFDTRSRFPLLLPGARLPAVPNGYESRYSAAEVEGAGVPFSVAAKIATPYIAKVVRQVRSEVVPEKLPDQERLEEILAWALAKADRED